MNGQLFSADTPPSIVSNASTKRQVRMAIHEFEIIVVRADIDGRLLLAPAGLRFLDV
jgi:hypothetical protein